MQTVQMPGPVPGRKLLMGAPAQRETRFATRSPFLSVPTQHCLRKWKRLRRRLPELASTRKPNSLRAKSPKRIDLRRVRYARHQLLSGALADPYYEFRAARRQKEANFKRFLLKNELMEPQRNWVVTRRWKCRTSLQRFYWKR
jgi:hypothetical protein